MQETWKNLEQIQELDLQIGQIMKKKSEQPARLSAFEKEVKSFDLELDEKNKTLSELERNKRQQMGAIELNEERSKRSQERMTSVSTSQELAALQKEIESLKKNSEVISTQVAKVDAEITKIKEEVAKIETSKNEVLTKKADEASKIQTEDLDLSSGLGSLQEKRTAIASLIEGRILTLYDRIRGARHGRGMSFTKEGRCEGCNMKLPPQLYNELQKSQNELRQCPSCKRILVFRADNTKLQ